MVGFEQMLHVVSPQLPSAADDTHAVVGIGFGRCGKHRQDGKEGYELADHGAIFSVWLNRSYNRLIAFLESLGSV